jgi:hypothetical protein
MSVAGGAIAAVAVLLAAVVSPADPNDRLDYAIPDATATAAAGPTPEASNEMQPSGEPSPAPSSEPGDGPGAQPASSDAPNDDGGPPPGDAGPEGEAEPEPTPREVAPAAREPYTEQPREIDAPAVCQGTPGQTDPYFASANGCGGYSSGGTSSTAQGGQATGTIGLCVSHNEDDLLLDFDGGQEHEVLVFDERNGARVYRFSDTVTYPQGAHQRRIAGGRCLTWTGVWDTTLGDGSDAPPGDYRVRILPVPSTANGQPVRSGDAGYMEFTVTVTD